ncbi:peptidase C69 [Alphaproteobacteria bacterium]|nr:peptidase C69 [Alphaproteobacteria bacterium]
MDFFSNICDLDNIEKAALGAFCGGNLGELFLEYREDESIRLEDGVVQTPSFSSRRGFGLRSFSSDSSRYSYSSSLDVASINKAVAVVNAGFSGDCSGTCVKSLDSSRKVLYEPHRFVDSITLEDKINFLKSMDSYARSKSSDIRQVVAVLASSWQVVNIVNDSGEKSVDFRPLVRLTLSIVIERNGLMESGAHSGGGRHDYQSLVSESVMKSYVDEALRQANVKLEAIKAPVGEMPLVLGNGWTGILLHEAIGHGLEGDAIRKKTSSFHNLLGEFIASSGVTVVDDGTIENHRGSINVDDEGTPSARNVLIENGKLVGFMQDRMNAKLMGVSVTGNGRRENYENLPIPRMTNTFMLSGDHSFDEMISSVKNGVFAKSFSDGQVDVASGKFVFSASEAYLIENGRVTTPIKGAMLIGDGPSILKKISMVGNDFALDPGIGTCGKGGQWVPVGVGEPSVLIDGITVGGANLG